LKFVKKNLELSKKCCIFVVQNVPEYRYGYLTGQRVAQGIETILETDKKVGVIPHPDLRVRIPSGTQIKRSLKYDS